MSNRRKTTIWKSDLMTNRPAIVGHSEPTYRYLYAHPMPINGRQPRRVPAVVVMDQKGRSFYRPMRPVAQ